MNDFDTMHDEQTKWSDYRIMSNRAGVGFEILFICVMSKYAAQNIAEYDI